MSDWKDNEIAKRGNSWGGNGDRNRNRDNKEDDWSSGGRRNYDANSNRRNDEKYEGRSGDGRGFGSSNFRDGASQSLKKDNWDSGRDGGRKRDSEDENVNNDNENRGFADGHGRYGGGRDNFHGDRRRDNDNNDDRRRDDNDEDGPHEEEKPREIYIPPEPTNNEEEIFNSGITSGMNFSNYDKIPVDVSGENPPPSITSFDKADFRDIVLQNIRKSGYTTPTPIQKAAIPVVSAGRDLMACAQTGSGKTAAFLLPIINTLLTDKIDLAVGRPQALVITPTRELALQIFNEARKFAHGSYLKITIIYGGTSVFHQSDQVAKGCHILIATPGRLNDFVSRSKIIFSDIRFVVLDEADRMLDMGFCDDIAKVMEHETMTATGERQTLMFSATFPEDIQHLASQYLNKYIYIAVGIVGGACSDVTQTIIETEKSDKRAQLMALLEEDCKGTIVFVETKRNADFLATILSEGKHPATSIHGDRLQSQREVALRDFRSGRMNILIATSVAARGLDIKNVCHVINYDLPKTIDEYVHRIGRTGRLGNKGRATSFFDPSFDSAIAGDLVRILKEADQEVPHFLLDLVGGGGDFYDHDKQRCDARGGNKESSIEPKGTDGDSSWD